MNFAWDEEKRRRNIEKHGIDFGAVLPVFDSPDALAIEDEGNDYGERRFILLCPLSTVLVHVTFAYRDDEIRIISARRATRWEQREYARRKHH